ncbi:hypothetical protein JHK87_034319 [Glycine soja]|nr:hypothetical protein JHK87_034319 [Glycine soja]
MEKVFKIFVYEEGESPLFHNGLNKDIYATEGRFIHEMEKGRYYRTYDPDEAFVTGSIVVRLCTSNNGSEGCCQSCSEVGVSCNGNTNCVSKVWWWPMRLITQLERVCIETFEGQKTWIGYTVLGQISEATMRLVNWESYKGQQGRRFGIGLVALGTVMGLETNSSPM